MNEHLHQHSFSTKRLDPKRKDEANSAAMLQAVQHEHDRSPALKGRARRLCDGLGAKVMIVRSRKAGINPSRIFECLNLLKIAPLETLRHKGLHVASVHATWGYTGQGMPSCLTVQQPCSTRANGINPSNNPRAWQGDITDDIRNVSPS